MNFQPSPDARLTRDRIRPNPISHRPTMIARATALRAACCARAQAECERARPRARRRRTIELIRAGFYRIVQPRCFGGYEFDVPTFHRVMMEVARGCPETGWVLALTAGHPLIVANFPLDGQREVYGADGEFRCPAAFNPPGTAVPGRRAAIASPRHGRPRPAATSARITSAARSSPTPTASRPRASSSWCSTRDQYRIVDDWHVMGMQGTGSKRIVVEDAFVPGAPHHRGGRRRARHRAGAAPRPAREPDVSRPHRARS